MTKPQKQVKFQHKDGLRKRRDSEDTSNEPHSPTRNGHVAKPEVRRYESYDANWTDDDKARHVRLGLDHTR